MIFVSFKTLIINKKLYLRIFFKTILSSNFHIILRYPVISFLFQIIYSFKICIKSLFCYIIFNFFNDLYFCDVYYYWCIFFFISYVSIKIIYSTLNKLFINSFINKITSIGYKFHFINGERISILIFL